MRKAILFTTFLLLITLVMWLDVRYNKKERVVSQDNYFISAEKEAASNVSENTDTRQNAERIILSFLNVGQGDAGFVEWPDGTQMLVDCGKDASVLGALGRVMKYFDKSIDYLIITHPDLDHYGGCIDVLKRFDVKNIVTNGLAKEDKGWKYLSDLIIKEGARYVEISNPEEWEINSSKIKFLYPDKKIIAGNEQDYNNTSIVFKLSYGESDVLFTGDAEKELEDYLRDKYAGDLNAEVLKVGHHGSPGSSSEDFVDLVSPDSSVISVGKDNDYGHPSLRVIRRLERVGSRVWRTDKAGDIIMYMGRDGIVSP